MTDTATRSHAQALAKLREARGDLLCARLAALDAQLWLVGVRVSNGGSEQDAHARVKRAAQLCALIADAVARAERLMFLCGGRRRMRLLTCASLVMIAAGMLISAGTLVHLWLASRKVDKGD